MNPVNTVAVPNDMVLISAPTRRDAEVTGRLLCGIGVPHVDCDSLESVARHVETGAGVVILTDSTLLHPGIGLLLTALSAQPSWSDIPVLLLASERGRSPRAVELQNLLPNVTLLDMPSSTRVLVSAVRAGLRARRRQFQLRDQLDALARAERALRDADRRKDEFLATLSHELRNPLAALRTGLQVLTRSAGDEARRTHLLGVMDRQSRLLVKLIDELMDLSRISTGKVVLRRERVDLRSVVEVAMETAQPTLEAARHTVVVDLPDEALWVVGDPSRLLQIVGNLVANAGKYTPDGGHIKVSLRREGQSALMCVADNGVGIPPEMLMRVFEMFTQVDRTLDRANGGLGIGLSLVRRLVELHGGCVDAASTGQGMGSTFNVRLPWAGDAPPSGDSPGSGMNATPAASRHFRALVIDDNADLANTFADLLRDGGHEAVTVFDGPSGLRAANSLIPDVVFCDIGMPGMSGHDVAESLRADRAFDHTLLVAVTGWGSDEDRRRSRQAGFDVHLTKPVNLDEIDSVLARLLI